MPLYNQTNKVTESLKLNLIARMYFVMVVIFVLLLSFMAYQVFANINDIENDVIQKNEDISYSLEKSFDSIRSDLYLQSRIIEINNGLISKNIPEKNGFKSLYLIDSDGKLIDSLEYADSHKINNFEMSFLLKLKDNDFAISNFLPSKNSGGAGYFYVAYRINEQFYLVGEIDIEYLRSVIKKEFGYLFDIAYIFDTNHNFIAGKYPEKTNEVIDFSKVSKEDQRINLHLDYFNSFAYALKYDSRYGFYIVSYVNKKTGIGIQTTLSILTIIFAIIFFTVLLLNTIMIKTRIINPLDEILKFILSDGKTSLEYGNIQDEMYHIKKGIFKLNKLVEKSADLLKDYQERFGYIYERSPICIVVYDAYSGKIVEASQAAQNLYGYSRDEMLDLNILDLMGFSVSLHELMFNRKKALDTGSSYSVKHYCKGGKAIDVKINISEIDLSDGKRLKFLIIKDVSHKLKRKTNIEVTNKYAYMSSSLIFVANKDEPFIIKNSTKNIQNIFGVNHEILLQNGYDIRELLAPSDKIAFTNEIEMRKKLFASSASNKDTLKFNVKMVAKDKVIPFRILIRFIRDSVGIFSEIVYSLTEFSEWQQIIENQEIEIKSYKNTIAASGVIPFEWDAGTDTVRVGDEYAHMLGYSNVKEMGILKYDRIRSFVLVDKSPKTSHDFLSRISLHDGDKISFSGDIPSYTKDGSIIWIRVKAYPSAYDSEGNVVKINGVLSNVSGLRESLLYKNMLATIFSYSDLSVVVMDLNGNVVDVNESFTQTMKYSHDEIVGSNISMIRSSLHGVDFYQNIWETLSKDGLFKTKIWNRTKDGEDILQTMTIASIYDDNAHADFCVALYSNPNNSNLTDDYLEHIAYHDPLTKLPNRFLFTRKLENIISEINDDTQIAVLYLDMDGFKDINDKYGYTAGDKFLIGLSSNLDSFFGDRETIARFGADEFGAIVSYKSRGEIDEIVQNVIKISKAPVNFEDKDIALSVSLGVSLYQKGLSASDMLEQADWAMYQAKLDGKNRYYIFDPKHDRHLKSQYDDGLRLLNALENGEMFLQYQPQVDIISSKINNFEALLRWRNGNKVVYPEEFLPHLKSQTILDDIAIFTIKEALLAQSQYASVHKDTGVSVNLRLMQICREDFFIKFEQKIAKSSYTNLSMLSIEITEISMYEDLEIASDYLNRYKSYGVKFALDDFASRATSLESLQMLPIDNIKLSRNLCKNLLIRKNTFLAINTLKNIRMAFGVGVVSKGVEDISTLRILTSLGFEGFQGFIIKEPMFLSDVLRYRFNGINDIDISYLMNEDEISKLSEYISIREIALKAIKISIEYQNSSDSAYFNKQMQELHEKLDKIDDSCEAIKGELKLAFDTIDIQERISKLRNVDSYCISIFDSVGVSRISKGDENGV